MTRRSDAMAVAFLSGALGAVACAHHDVEIQALPDGTRAFTCRFPLPQCLSYVDDACKGNSYEVLYGVDTQKMYGSPSESEVENRTSEAVVHCLGPHQKPRGGMPDGKGGVVAPVAGYGAAAAGDGAAGYGAVSAAAGASGVGVAPVTAGGGVVVATGGAVTSTQRACVPGATQSCVGPGACAGGQACLADGSGFGACDCGGVKTP